MFTSAEVLVSIRITPSKRSTFNFSCCRFCFHRFVVLWLCRGCTSVLLSCSTDGHTKNERNVCTFNSGSVTECTFLTDLGMKITFGCEHTFVGPSMPSRIKGFVFVAPPHHDESDDGLMSSILVEYSFGLWVQEKGFMHMQLLPGSCASLFESKTCPNLSHADGRMVKR